MKNSTRHSKVVQVGAWYDLIATIAFVTPWTFSAVYAGIGRLALALSLPGGLPAFDPLQAMMVNMMGSAVIVWALLRIRDPQVGFAIYSVAIRVLFIVWQLYALWHGASPIVLGFSVVLFGFALAEILAIRHTPAPRSTEAGTGAIA